MGDYLDADFFDELGAVASDLCRLPSLVQRLLMKLDEHSIDADGEYASVWAALTPLQGGGVPVGTMWPYFGLTAPDKWLLCDGGFVSMGTYGDLLDLLIDSTTADGGTVGTRFGYNAATAVTFTVDVATDKLLAAGHNLQNNTVVMLDNSGGALPAELGTNTKYYVVNADVNDFELATTQGGAAIDLTDAGTGTHSAYLEFAVPDLRGRVPAGLDSMGGVSANVVTDAEADRVGAGMGEELHTLTENELASHTHEAYGNTGGVPIYVNGYGYYWSSPLRDTYAAPYNQGGGGDAAHNTMQPTTFVSYIIYAGV
jgi:microcystin-dependent protein